jgi:hypothetical protein
MLCFIEAKRSFEILRGLRALGFKSEIFMRQLGCKKIQWHVKVTNNWTHILERLGYAKEDIVMGKVV